jgi:hypothetical protein
MKESGTAVYKEERFLFANVSTDVCVYTSDEDTSRSVRVDAEIVVRSEREERESHAQRMTL